MVNASVLRLKYLNVYPFGIVRIVKENVKMPNRNYIAYVERLTTNLSTFFRILIFLHFGSFFSKYFIFSRFYISCDVCDLWFHGKCVGIKPDEGDDMPAFICQECSRNQNGTIQPMIKPLTNRDVQRAKDVVDLLEKHKMSWPFRRAVDFNSHPKYLRIVQDPMGKKKNKKFFRRFSYMFWNKIYFLFRFEHDQIKNDRTAVSLFSRIYERRFINFQQREKVFSARIG